MSLPSAARDYPTRPLGLANLQKGNRRLHSRERRPSKSGRPARHRDPTSHRNGSAPNAAAPTDRSIGEDARLFFGRQEPPSARPNRRHPTPARHPAPDPHSLAPYWTATHQLGRRPTQLPRIERRTLGRARALRVSFDAQVSRPPRHNGPDLTFRPQSHQFLPTRHSSTGYGTRPLRRIPRTH